MINIREYTAVDRDGLRACVGALHDSLRAHDNDLADTGDVLDAHFNHMLLRLAETDGLILVAEDDGRIVGHAIVFGRVVPTDVDEVAAPFSLLEELFVRSEYRGRGIGSRLMGRIEAHSESLGVGKIELRAFASNAEAVGFYRKRGYADRVITMKKSLRSGPPPSRRA